MHHLYHFDNHLLVFQSLNSYFICDTCLVLSYLRYGFVIHLNVFHLFEYVDEYLISSSCPIVNYRILITQ